MFAGFKKILLILLRNFGQILVKNLRDWNCLTGHSITSMGFFKKFNKVCLEILDIRFLEFRGDEKNLGQILLVYTNFYWM